MFLSSHGISVNIKIDDLDRGGRLSYGLLLLRLFLLFFVLLHLPNFSCILKRSSSTSRVLGTFFSKGWSLPWSINWVGPIHVEVVAVVEAIAAD